MGFAGVMCPSSPSPLQSAECCVRPPGAPFNQRRALGYLVACVLKVQSAAAAAAALSAAPAHNSSFYVIIFIFLFCLLVLHVHISIFKQTLPRSSLPPNTAEEEEKEEVGSAVAAAFVTDVTATLVGK